MVFYSSSTFITLAPSGLTVSITSPSIAMCLRAPWFFVFLLLGHGVAIDMIETFMNDRREWPGVKDGKTHTATFHPIILNLYAATR